MLTYAFAGTAQRGETLPIIYDEFGYQSQIPAATPVVYSHLGATVASDAIPEARQATYYRQAFALAACQPTVAGMLIFHVVDERDARAWQSGLYYGNGRPKTSLPGSRCGARRADREARECATGRRPRRTSTTSLSAARRRTPRPCFKPGSRAFAVQLRAAGPRRDDRHPVASASGKAVGPTTVKIPAAELPPGQYEYALRAFKCGKPGTAETRFSTASPSARQTRRRRELPTLEPVVP